MEDEDLIALSALQHYLYCPRQCALIHIERVWTESAATAEGRLLHQKADEAGTEIRHGVRTATAMPLRSNALGISGVADVVEFHAPSASAPASTSAADAAPLTTEADTKLHLALVPLPVEYKRGRPKQHRADEVQLCAQALCLEEMLATHVPEGMLFYGKTRRRKAVDFDVELRTLTLQTIAATRTMIAAGQTPTAQYDAKRCDACSLIDDCQPHWLGRKQSAAQWLAQQVK
ncbi:CRISPR-associated protein Cas4 [Lampropedia puyangensis]|uniref:CRISPR-associated exonuclease Cas4 n=1 Tax=Lampropedia puyangensis TaxID=1330072 RepID=A0A4S8FB11_9BURK|nr:CRISPR-associated protein Cas4 [Lampropedia puyangensis]THU04477.1 CRISPR-associated protein Cas4 [Lampropedia puyangensis]